MDAESGPLAPEAVVEFHDAAGPRTRWFCTPERLEELAAGWLLGEGLVRSAAHLAGFEVDPDGGRVTYAGRAADPFPLPTRTPLRSPDLLAAMRAKPALLHGAFSEMFERSVLRERTGGIHTGALFDEGAVVCVREDVSRHCVVDKLVGWAGLDDRPLERAVVLLTGRISGAIAAKLARCGVAAGATMSVPTTLAARIAADAGVTLVGRARSGTPYLYEPPVS